MPTDEVPVSEENTETQPRPTPTPFRTWEEEQNNSQTNQNTSTNSNQKRTTNGRTVTVMICPISGVRATSNCPTKEIKTFEEGKEPKDFCQFHRGK